MLRASGKIALPGLIDTHVHLRDMRLSYKEDFTTGTMAAAAGGFTSVLDMPNTKPITDSSSRLREKIRRAKTRIVTNVGFHVAAVPDENTIEEACRLGAFSLKLYMPKPLFPLEVNDDDALTRLFSASGRAGLPLTIHAEDMRQIHLSTGKKHSTPNELASERPAKAEKIAVDRVISLAERSFCRVHLCHLTLPSSILSVRRHRPYATSEVTPHHMLLSSRTTKKERWKAWMVPPLRDEETRQKLMNQVLRGLVDVIASDHAPHTIQEKSPDGGDPAPGIPGLETALPLMLTLVKKELMSLSRLVHMCSRRPASVFGLKRKGLLDVGFDGDVTIVDLKAKGRIRAQEFFSKAKYTPFENVLTQGRVFATVANGKVVFQDGNIVASPGAGKIISPLGVSD